MPFDGVSRIKRARSEREALASASSLVPIGNRNSKMPGPVFSVATHACGVGGDLAKIEGSVCHGCYAARLEKFRENVAASWDRNLELFMSAIDGGAAAREAWIAAAVLGIREGARLRDAYMRWFDAGDLPHGKSPSGEARGPVALAMICEVSRRTPEIAHWLPTREAKAVRAYLATGARIPANLALRLSAPMIDQRPVTLTAAEREAGILTSTVHRKPSEARARAAGEVCEADTRGQKCGPCRACWDRGTANVSYRYH